MTALRQGALADFFNRFPELATIFKTIMPGAIRKITEDTKKHEAHTMALVQKRINKESDRPDFMTRMLENRDKDEVSDIQLAAHSSDFVTAGSETTATTLSAITYYLMRTPEVYQKLKDEIRGNFKSYEDITSMSTQSLEYLHAVSLEACVSTLPCHSHFLVLYPRAVTPWTAISSQPA